METPSSARRITRSQALAAASNSNSNNIPMSKSEKGVSKSRNRGKPQDRSALIDITNDSPIVGLAMGSLGTPLSTLSKRKNNTEVKQNTPGSGSGEALLRGQVKTLLQKVEEEAELSKISLEIRPDFVCVKGLVNSPMGLLAPTPANTPQVSNLSSNESANKMDLASVESSPVEEQFNFSQMLMQMLEGKKQETVETEKDLITRSLLLDFSEKSEGSSVSSSDCTSVLTYQGSSEDNTEKNKKSTEDDDDTSIWSIQVNRSVADEEEEEEYEEEEEFEENDEEYEEGEEDEGLLDDLCEGISKISVNNGEKITAKFAGKHTRFVYNTDDEIEGEEEAPAVVSEGILRLKGLPTPKGKHVRFAEEE